MKKNVNFLEMFALHENIEMRRTIVEKGGKKKCRC